jgi:hypothetical protein
MKQYSTGYVMRVVAIGMGLVMPLDSALAADNRGQSCSERTIQGTYGIQFQGKRPSAPGGPIEAVIGIVIRHYDGKGGITQVDNVKGAISGYVADRAGSGTYLVNDDCSVVVHFQPAPGVFIEERLVIVDNGHELRGITTLPPPLMVTSVQLKM